jgi:regulatory helix-turn-helix LysR family protein
MDRLTSINAFVRVAESGGFSAAARRLHLSKATISEQVQALENAIGVRLLNSSQTLPQSDCGGQPAVLPSPFVKTGHQFLVAMR